LTLYTYDTTKARSLLREAGYPNGFDLKLISQEGWKLEGRIISKMLERVGLVVEHDALAQPEYVSMIHHPNLIEPPEEQDWDIALFWWADWFGHTGTTFLSYPFLEESDFRWIEYDPDFEQMWKDMARTVDRKAQEEKIRRLVEYVYEHAHILVIYSPISLYALNKEVNYEPNRPSGMKLKDASVTDNHWSLRSGKR
jgi:peptide/nickel transport system substrate-binding protein